MAISEPLTLIEVSRTSSEAAPLKRPNALASTTVPVAVAPVGIAVRPSIVIGLATVAVKVWPAVLIFEPSASAKRTVKHGSSRHDQRLRWFGFHRLHGCVRHCRV